MRLSAAVMPVPQVLMPWLLSSSELAATAEKWFWMATRASQSSTRSLLVPGVRELAAVSTKVPSAQPAAERAVNAVPLLGMILWAWQAIGS